SYPHSLHYALPIYGGGPRVHSRNPSARSLAADGGLGEPGQGAFQSGCSSANPRARLGAQSKKTTEAGMSWAARRDVTTTWLLITSNSAVTLCPCRLATRQGRGWPYSCGKE